MSGGQTRIRGELKDRAYMSKVVHLECLGRLLCLEALNMGKKKKIKVA